MTHSQKGVMATDVSGDLIAERSGKSGGDLSGQGGQGYDVEQIARLMRYSRDGNLSEKSRDVVKGYILNQLGVAPQVDSRPNQGAPLNKVSAPKAQPAAVDHEVYEQPVTTAISAPVVTVPPIPTASVSPRAGAGVAADTRPGITPQKEQDFYFQLELKVRHLVEADADWETIEPYVLEMIRLHDDSQTIAKVAELAFLRAKQTELEKLFLDMRLGLTRAWMQVHSAVRAHLIVRFWRCGGSHILGPVVYRYKDHHELQPIEKLFILHNLTGAKDASLPWIYYKQYRVEIEDAVRSLGSYVGMDENRFFLEIGKVALDLGFEKEGRSAFERITPDSNEHEDALQLMLHASADQRKNRKSHYIELLIGHGDLNERLRVFSSFFDNTRGLGGFRDRNRPALNELLENPLEWLQPTPDIFRRLSEILLMNRDLEPLLPNLFNFFKENSLKFHNKDNEIALWSAVSELKPANARDRYWKALGHLHLYVNTGPGNEVLLWRARQLVNSAREDSSMPLLYDWRVLHKTAYSWVAKSPFLVEPERQKMLGQLRIAVTTEFLVLGDISDYLEANENISLEVSDHLLKLCQEKRAVDVEMKVLTKRALSSHFTNDQLNRVWQLATASNNYDLAWRTASVVNARGCLHSSVRHPWEISGEKRANYPLNPLNKKVVSICSRGLPHAAQKIIWALVHIGHLLPELLSYLDRGSSSARAVGYPADSLERRADDALNALGWLPQLKRRYRFSFDATSGLSKVPAFAQVLPSNLWGIVVAHLSERLGVNSFQWKMSSLHDQITDLIPRMAGRQDLRRHSSKVASWLKDLSPEQRSAWHDLASLSRAMDDETARDALAVFVTRLATVIYQNHYLAIQSLQAMRVNVQILWMLEAWMLSDGYRMIRKELGYESRVPVPNSLIKLETILSR